MHGLAHAPLDKRLRTLKGSLRKLYLTTQDRPIARRNARRRVLSALRLMRTTVDEHFPAIVERSAPRERKSPEQRIKALEKAGWIRHSTTSLGAYAAAGVPIKHFKWKVVTESQSPGTYVKGKGWVHGTTKNTVTHEVHLIPRWAYVIGPDKPTELRAAKKSMKLRKAALVVEGLR